MIPGLHEPPIHEHRLAAMVEACSSIHLCVIHDDPAVDLEAMLKEMERLNNPESEVDPRYYATSSEWKEINRELPTPRPKGQPFYAGLPRRRR